MKRARIIKILNRINASFDELQTMLIDEYGDEGNDIGDAYDAIELLQNSMIRHAYDRCEFRRCIATFCNVDVCDIDATYQHIKQLTNKQVTTLRDATNA